MELTEKKKRVDTDMAENNGAQGASGGSMAANEAQTAVAPTKASDAYKARLDALSAPQAYTPKYETQINDTIDKILNREEFSYDINGDALYNQYKDQYIKSGKLAMEDTMARAAAMTGGYSNTWAQTAGQAAYSQELSKLNDVIPELYQMALDKYNAEGNTLRNNYALLTDADNAAYSRYRDSKNDYLTERDYLQSLYDNERSWEYQLSRDKELDARYDAEWQNTLERQKVEDARYDAEWQYQKERDAESDARYADEVAYEREQDAKSWQYQYDQDAYERGQDSYDRRVDEALMRAQYGGDFSGLATLLDIDEETARELWYAQNTENTEPDETSLYGGYTKKEFAEQMTQLLQFGDAETAAKLVALAGTPEAQAVYDIYFGGKYSGGGDPRNTSYVPITAGAMPTYGGSTWVNAKTDFDKTGDVLDRTVWEDAKASNNQSKVIRGFKDYDSYIEFLAMQRIEQGWSTDEAMEWAQKYIGG